MSNIQDVRAINNPQRSYMWEISVLGLSSGALPDMSFYAKTVSIPQTAVEQMILNHKSSKTHHAGRDASAHTFTVTYWDDEAQTIGKYFNDWMNIIRNSQTGQGSTKDIYVADFVIKLMDAADENVVSTITMKGSFPMDVAEVALSYDSSEAVEYSITFSYDVKEIA